MELSHFTAKVNEFKVFRVGNSTNSFMPIYSKSHEFMSLSEDVPTVGNNPLIILSLFS